MGILEWFADNYSNPALIAAVVVAAMIWPFWEKLLANAADAAWAALSNRFHPEKSERHREGP